MLRKGIKMFVAGAAMALSPLCSSTQDEYPFVQVFSYRANDPIEDRSCYTKLKAIDGFTATVFDGHGGDLTVSRVKDSLSMLRRTSTKPSTTESASTRNWIFLLKR